MRFMPVFLAALAVALAAMLIGMSGVGAVIGFGSTGGIVEETEGLSNQSQNETVDPQESGGGLLGDTVASLRMLRDGLLIVVFLPAAFEAMGAPWWAARVLGHAIQILLLLFAAQVIRGLDL